MSAQLVILPANEPQLSCASLDNEQLATLVIDGIVQFRKLLPFVKELRARFAALPRGHANIAGCKTWTEFCHKRLDRTDAAVRKALAPPKEILATTGVNPAIAQLADLREKFPTRRIERTGGTLNGYEMTEFQVWVENVPASQTPKGKEKVTVVLTLDQLRQVKGTVSVGKNNLTAKQAAKFLKAWE
jgi:hypothetical protein